MTPSIKNSSKIPHQKVFNYKKDASFSAGKNKVTCNFIVPFFQSGDYCFALVNTKELGLRVIACDENFRVTVLTLDALVSVLNPQLTGLNLFKHIVISDLYKFDFLLDKKSHKIYVSPKLKAAAKEGSLDSKTWESRGVKDLEKSVAAAEYALNELVFLERPDTTPSNQDVVTGQQVGTTYSKFNQPIIPNPELVKEYIDPDSRRPFSDASGEKIYVNQPDPLLRIRANELANFMGEVVIGTNDKPLLVYRVLYADPVRGINKNARWFGVLPPEGNIQHALDHALDPSFYKRDGIVDAENHIVSGGNKVAKICGDGRIVSMAVDKNTGHLTETTTVIGYNCSTNLETPAQLSSNTNPLKAQYDLQEPGAKPFFISNVLGTDGKRQIKAQWFDSPDHILIAILEPGALFAVGKVAPNRSTHGGAKEQLFLLRPNALDHKIGIAEHLEKNNFYTILLKQVA